MRNTVSFALCVLGLATAGCGATTDPYEEAAQEVEGAVAALGSEDADTALDGIGDDRDGDSDEVADEAAVGPDGGVDPRGGRHHPRGHRHGHGARLLLWYADLDALQACRDLREECVASDEQASCREDVHACVRPIFEDAFAAMCEERLALCEADDAHPRPCQRIRKHCAEHPPQGAPLPAPPQG